MAVIHNISTKHVHIPPDEILPPRKFTVRPHKEMQTSPAVQILRDKGQVGVYHLSEVAEMWPDWVEIEYTMFLHWGMKVEEMKPDGEAQWSRSANRVSDYLDEKLPHKEISVVYGSEYYALCCLAGLSAGMWSRVLLPELTKLIKEQFFHMFYAQRDAKRDGRIDVKLYFMWDYILPDSLAVPWYDVNDYKRFDSFCKRLKDLALEQVAQKEAGL